MAIVSNKTCPAASSSYSRIYVREQSVIAYVKQTGQTSAYEWDEGNKEGIVEMELCGLEMIRWKSIQSEVEMDF